MSNISHEDIAILLEVYRKQTEVNVQFQTQQQHTLEKMNGIIDLQEKTCDIVNDSSKSISNNLDKLIEMLHTDRVEEIKEHDSIKNKIYVALIGMCTIVLSLLAMMFK